MTYEQMRLKQLRHTYSVQGWSLLVYYGVLNVAVLAVMLVDAFKLVLIFSDTLTRLTAHLPRPWDQWNVRLIVILFSVAALAALVIKRREIARYFRENRNDPQCAKAFFTAPGILIFTVLMLLMIVLTMLIM